MAMQVWQELVKIFKDELI